MTATDYIKTQLATFAIRQGYRYGGMDNMMAAALVIRNRHRAGWGDWLDVIEGHWRNAPLAADELELQAPVAGADYIGSAMGQPTRWTKQTRIDLRDPLIVRLLHVIDAIHAGAIKDELTEGALYFAALNEINQDNSHDMGFVERIVRAHEKHPRIATVGLVSFFK